MKKIVKLLVLVAVLAVCAFGALLVFINPIIDRLKPQLTQKLSDTLGREVRLGELDVSLFPSVAITAEQVGLADVPEKEASVGALILRTKLMPLLRGELAVDKLTLNDTALTLVRESDGRLTLGGITLAGGPKSAAPAPGARPPAAGQPPAPAPSTEVPEPEAPAAGEPAPARQQPTAPEEKPAPPAVTDEEKAQVDFQLRNAEINNLDIVFIDRSVSPEVTLTLSDLHAEAQDIGPDSEGTFSLAVSALGTTPQNLAVSGSVNLGKRLAGIPETNATLQIASLDLAKLASLLQSYGAGHPDLHMAQSLQAKFDLSINDKGIRLAPTIDASKAQLRFGEQFNKEAGVPLTLNAELLPTLLGAVTGQKLTLTLGTTTLNAPFTFDPRKGTNAQIETGDIDLASLQQFLPAAAPYQLQGKMKADVDVVAPKDGKPAAKGVATLQQVAATVPREGGEAKEGEAQQQPLRITELDGTLRFEGSNAELKPLTFSLGGQRFTAGAKVENFNSPSVNIALQSETIKLGELMSAIKPGGIPALQTSVLNKLNLLASFSQASKNGTASLTLAESKVAEAPLKNVNLQATYQLGEQGLSAANLKKSTISLFGGTLGLEAALSGQNALQFAFDGAGLDLAQLSAVAMPDGKIKLAGNLKSAQGRFNTDPNAFAPALQGNARIAAEKGEITGFNLFKAVLEKAGAIPGVAASLESLVPEQYRGVLHAEGTKFDSLVIASNVARQTANVGELNLTHELYSVTGDGTIGFDGKLNLDTQFRLSPKLAQGMTLKEPKLKLLLDKDGNLTIPVVIKKDGAVPIVLPDVSRLAENAARNTAKEAGKRALDKVAPGLGGALDSLFK